MRCCFCKHWKKAAVQFTGGVCGLISMEPRPFERILPGGCFPWECLYNQYGSTMKCPLCACEKPDYPNGKHKDGCPMCSKADKFGGVISGSFCDHGIRIQRGFEYPRPYMYPTDADECVMAEPAEGAFEKALDEILKWNFVPCRKYFSVFFHDHKFCRDGSIKRSDAGITLRELIRVLEPVLPKIKQEGKWRYVESLSEYIREQFGVYVHDGDKYSESAFYAWVFWKDRAYEPINGRCKE